MLVELESLVPSMSTDLNERNLRDFILFRCVWRPQESTSIFALFDAYKEYVLTERKTTPEGLNYISKRLSNWNYQVGAQTVAGICLRTDRPDTSAAYPWPSLTEKLATRVTSELIQANNPIEPEQPKETVFDSATPAM